MSKLVVLTLIIIVAALVTFGAYYYFNTQPSKPNPSLSIGKPVTKEPASLTLDLTSPDDDLLVFQPEISVEGKTAPKSQILLSTQSNDMVVETKTDGSFSASLNLSPGLNEIQVVVFDESGDQRSATRTVYYSKEKI